jgi:hypothetical protein
LASANFSEVRSLNKKCRMKSVDPAAQLRNLGLNLNGVRMFPYSISVSNTPPSDCIDVFAGSDITIENGQVDGGALTYFFATGIYVNAGATAPYIGGAVYGNGGSNPVTGDLLTFDPGSSPSSGGTIWHPDD